MSEEMLDESDIVPVVFVKNRGWFIDLTYHNEALSKAHREAWEAARELADPNWTSTEWPQMYPEFSDWEKEKAREGGK